MNVVAKPKQLCYVYPGFLDFLDSLTLGSRLSDEMLMFLEPPDQSTGYGADSVIIEEQTFTLFIYSLLILLIPTNQTTKTYNH